MIVITADHGEEFNDHGDLAHGMKLYDELLKVPLIINGPNITHSLLRRPVSLRQLCATLFHAAGIAVPSGMPQPIALVDRQKVTEPVFFQSYVGTHRMTPNAAEFSRLHYLAKLHGCRVGKWKGIYSSESDLVALFDMTADVWEHTSCSQRYPKVAEELLSILKILDRQCESQRLYSKIQHEMGF
jgi:arylsulfatase A-like enzyme